MAQAFAFDTSPDRFDMHVMAAFAASNVSRHVRDRLIAQVRNGRMDHFLLKRLKGLETLTYAANERAAINLIDFYFEPLVLQSMSNAQADAYFNGVEKTLQITEAFGLDGGGPLWVDTVHHTCVFSMLYLLCVHLLHQCGYRRLVLLHQGQRAEPRLGVMSRVLQQMHGAETHAIAMNGAWFPALSRITAADTAIFYLTDMPREARRRAAAKDSVTASVQLDAELPVPIRLETLSGSAAFARRLRAAHVVVDYTGPGTARIRPYDALDPVSRCPLEDWAFWPMLKVA